MTKWPLHGYPREYLEGKKKGIRSIKGNIHTLKRKIHFNEGKKNPSCSNKKKFTSLSKDAGDMLTEKVTFLQSEHSWESSISCWFKLLTTAVLVWKEKTG